MLAFVFMSVSCACFQGYIYLIIFGIRWWLRSDVTRTGCHLVTGALIWVMELVGTDEDFDIIFLEELNVVFVVQRVWILTVIGWIVGIVAQRCWWVLGHGFVLIWWGWDYDYVIFVIYDNYFVEIGWACMFLATRNFCIITILQNMPFGSGSVVIWYYYHTHVLIVAFTFDEFYELRLLAFFL